MTSNLHQKNCQEKPDWLGKMTRRSSIIDKISCGYILALGISLLGTAAGVTISNKYLQQARGQTASADAEKSYVASLQQEAFQTRLHQQQMILLLGQRVKLERQHEDYLRDLKEFKELLSELPHEIDSSGAEKLKGIILRYKGALENYWLRAEEIFVQLDLLALPPDKVLAAREKMIDFANSEVALQLDSFSQELEKLDLEAHEKHEVASEAIEKAEVLRTNITAVSWLLSATIAAIIAFYIIRAIAQPLKIATDVAKKVTKDSNFNLQIPVTTEDEVGVLTVTLNQLIYQVKQLLDAQKAESMQQIIQNEKMASLGRMVAGISHEVNNAVNCIYGNISPLTQYTKDLLSLIDSWEAEISTHPQEVKELSEEIELEFLKEDLPKLLESMKFGADRAIQILLSLKDFSRLDTAQSSIVNLHDCIDSTLLILHSRLKNGIKIVRNYGDIIAIEGYTGFLYQVFMNLFTNALDALEEVEGVKEIIITTERVDKDWIVVRIKDAGWGIEPENLEKIFEIFFTTKPRGFGTGLGLAISYQIVVEKHGGKLTVASEVGKGTEFTISLPVKHFSSEPTAVSEPRHLEALVG